MSTATIPVSELIPAINAMLLRIRNDRAEDKDEFLASWLRYHNRYRNTWLRVFLGPPWTFEDARAHWEGVYPNIGSPSIQWEWWGLGLRFLEQEEALVALLQMASHPGLISMAISPEDYTRIYGKKKGA